LVVFVPTDHVEKVRNAIFRTGGGNIGGYDSCSFNLEGKGTFRGSAETNPFVGKAGEMHEEREVRIETIVPEFLTNLVVKEMINAHPYEEVAYDIYPLENTYDRMGMGMIGELEEPLSEEAFLTMVKDRFQTGCIRHSALLGKDIRRVAVSGGAGSFLLAKAISYGADILLSADFKYHQFFEAEGKIVIMDIGHYESEQFTRQLFYDLLTKKFPKFAVRLSALNTNPIKYY
jgi:hypothetical protein